MSAGYIQLVALGQQDAYLTGEPKVTYFSGVYKRHTPFVLEAYDIPFNDQYVTYGGTSICRIPPKGDLVRGLTLKMTLPALYNPGSDWTWPLTPSATNVPQLWFGLTNGTIVSAVGSYNVPYYSTNLYSSWSSAFFPTYGTYNSGTNQFSFTYSSGSVGLSNVIVQSTLLSNNAGSGVFWGLDPVNYSYQDQYGNLVYTATSNTVTPDFTLQQSGWVQTQGNSVLTLTGFYAGLQYNYPLVPGTSFLNLNQSILNNQLFYVFDSNDAYAISTGGCIIFVRPGFYTIQAGFNIDVGTVLTFGYTVQSTDMGSVPTIPSSFEYTYTFTVSPTPSTPAVIPIQVTSTTQFYCFYFSTNSSGNFIPGTYFSIQRANEVYQLASPVNLPSATSSKVSLYGNVLAYSNTSVTLNTDSTFKFSVNGEYLVTGVLSVSNTLSETYVQNVSVCSGSSVLYTYDMSQQGRNPTYAFSIPVVASNVLSYSINVGTQTSFSNLSANSFFAITQTGVKSDTNPSIVLPYNGILLQSNTSTLTSPLNLKTNFTSNTNSNAMVSVNAQGNLVFANAFSYMLTGVFYTSNPVTNVIITNSKSNFIQSYNPTISFSDSPPWTVSVPFHVYDNTASYGVTLVTTPSGGSVNNGTYISVVPIASNIFIGNFGKTFGYYDSVGTLAIRNADLKIGGQTIQTLSGEYIEAWNELNIPYENQPGLQLLTGKYDTGTSVGPPGRTYYVNLPFYFYDRPELSLPIVALDRQDVEVWVTFNNFSNLTSVSLTSPSLFATIITEYAYLSNPEIDWFQNHQLDYVITQCQYDTFPLAQNIRTTIFELFFRHPVKELLFFIQPNGNAPYDYSGNGLASLGLTFNGEDAFLASTTNDVYVGTLEPFLKHNNFFTKAQGSATFGRQFHMYSFSKDPYGTVSAGQINFSRIRQVLLETNFFNALGNYPAKTLRIVATNQNILRFANGIAGLMFTA